jgi:hypothetical protein
VPTRNAIATNFRSAIIEAAWLGKLCAENCR